MRHLIIFLSITLLGNAGAAVSGLYTYTVNADNVSVTITDYPTDATGEISIPDTIDGRSVTTIGDLAFYNCTGLTSINIPNSVTSIGRTAFYNCASLTSVIIGNSVTSIGYSAFNGANLTYSLVDGVKYLFSDSYAFLIDGSSAIGDLSLPSNVDSKPVRLIADYAFGDCTGLTSINIPNSVTSIGYGAFFNCASLTSITIPDSVTSIGSQAFYYCTGLTSINIPNSVTSIGPQAFFNCSNLASILLEPMAAPTIGSFAFDGISSAAIIQYPYGATGYAASYDGVPTEEAAPPPDPLSPIINIGDFYESSAGVSVVVSAIPTAGYPTNFSYQWHFNNFTIPANFGGTAASYTIDGISSNDVTWRVVVTNDTGSTEASFEYRVFADSDSDGLSDGREEFVLFTDPDDPDSDGDGLTDGDEVNTYNSSPIDSDSDDDTILDGIEVRHATFGFDPAVDSSARLAELIALVEEFPGVSTDEELIDLRTGSTMLSINGLNAVLQLQIQRSDDLSTWSSTSEDLIEVELPMQQGKGFFRFAMPQ